MPLKSVINSWYKILNSDAILNHVLISYTNWIPGVPDNFGGHEKCVVMYRAGDGASGWDDAECCLHRTYACEKVCTETRYT